MIPVNLEKINLNLKTIEFIKTLRDALPFFDKKKVEKSLGISKSELKRVLNGEVELSAIQLTKLSRDFNFSLKALGEGKIDLNSIINKFQGISSGMPRRYNGKPPRVKNYFLISALNDSEKTHGPNLKKLALDYLQIEDHLNQDPEGLVNLDVLVDLLIFFYEHGMSEEEIINLGVYSFRGLLGLPDFANFESPQAFFKFFYEEVLTKEAASHYHFTLKKNSDKELVVQIKDTPETLEYTVGQALGSPYCCLYMLGGFKEVLTFQGISQFSDSHPQCRHRGDEYCTFEFKYH